MIDFSAWELILLDVVDFVCVDLLTNVKFVEHVVVYTSLLLEIFYPPICERNFYLQFYLKLKSSLKHNYPLFNRFLNNDVLIMFLSGQKDYC